MTFPDSTTPAGNGTIPATGGAASVDGSIAPAADCPFDLPLGPPVILPAILPASQADWPEILAVLETANMHHIPSPEMPEFDLACAFVVRLVGKLVGVAGYKVLSPTTAKTTLLAVLPEARRCGVGRLLQERRMDALCALGIRTLTTNSDRPETIAWYEKHFGYVRVGALPKLHPFGATGIDHWTTLETDLTRWRKAP